MRFSLFFSQSQASDTVMETVTAVNRESLLICCIKCTLCSVEIALESRLFKCIELQVSGEGETIKECSPSEVIDLY